MDIAPRDPCASPNTPFHLRIGYLPLMDAAPLLIAQHKGFYADEHLAVQLLPQPGWSALREQLTAGTLHAAHALLGMPLASQLGRDSFAEPLLTVMNLGSGAGGITLSTALAQSAPAILSATPPDHPAAALQFPRLRRQLVFAHVFNTSVYHYLLRDLLQRAGLNLDLHVKLCVVPPGHLVDHLAKGYIDGFCAGEPWNTLAIERNAGTVLAWTSDLLPDHPDKVLAVTTRFARQHPDALHALLRALLKSAAWCANPANAPELAALLSPDLATPRTTLRTILARTHSRIFNPTFPSQTHTAWLAAQMIRSGQLSPAADPLQLALRCTDPTPYRHAAASLQLALPATDTPPMPLTPHQHYDPTPTRIAAG